MAKNRIWTMRTSDMGNSGGQQHHGVLSLSRCLSTRRGDNLNLFKGLTRKLDHLTSTDYVLALVYFSGLDNYLIKF